MYYVFYQTAYLVLSVVSSLFRLGAIIDLATEIFGEASYDRPCIGGREVTRWSLSLNFISTQNNRTLTLFLFSLFFISPRGAAPRSILLQLKKNDGLVDKETSSCV